jgi:hypothetical protein
MYRHSVLKHKFLAVLQDVLRQMYARSCKRTEIFKVRNSELVDRGPHAAYPLLNSAELLLYLKTARAESYL